jgi:hypothetical protein
MTLWFPSEVAEYAFSNPRALAFLRLLSTNPRRHPKFLYRRIGAALQAIKVFFGMLGAVAGEPAPLLN